ncbi:MAG TPA: hypothetical protein VFE23_10525 [Usitatibacter sp.]|jgi:hypothetical protein|nr:hypothetical protein [Usitatibacter sp.]
MALPKLIAPNTELYEQLKSSGDAAFAWEFMRRSSEYKQGYWLSILTDGDRIPERDVAAWFGISKIKPINESYFEGDKPKYVALRSRSFDFKAAEDRWARQKHKLFLSEGQVSLTFDLRVPLNDQLEIAGKRLNAHLGEWTESGWGNGPPQRVRRARTDSSIDLLRYVQAWDLKRFKRRSAEEIARELRVQARGSVKSAGEKLLDGASYYVNGGYRILAMRAAK